MDVPFPDGIPPAAATDLLARADTLRDSRAWADAAELYAAYLRRNPDHWQIWVQYGHCTKECGDPETALLLYREAERLRPEEADVQLHLGHALKLLGRRDEAGEAYARALALDPANDAARAELMASAAAAAAEPTPPPVREAPAATTAAACVFDVSDLLDHVRSNRAPTGIQRVQLNLIEQSLRPGPSAAAVAAFDAASGAWKPIPRAVFERLAALSRSGADPADPDWEDAVSEALDAVRHGAAAGARARRHPGHPRHRLVDTELPAARARGQGAARPALRAAGLRLHPRPGARALHRPACPPNSPPGSPAPASTPTPCW